MKLALVQYSPVWEDKKSNREKIKILVEQIEKVDLIILPELSLTGFTMNAEKLSEELSGETFQFYSGLALHYKSDLIGGIIEKDSDKFFNTLLHIDSNGKLISKYRKIHPFSYSDEDKFYDKGNDTVILEINGWKTGVSICYDLRFPELYRFYGKERVDLIINIANWPDTRIEHWRTLLKARAIENQCYVAAVNRVGDDPKLHYKGFSSVFDPMGKEIITNENEEKILIAEIDKYKVDEVRNKFPFLNDIRLI